MTLRFTQHISPVSNKEKMSLEMSPTMAPKCTQCSLLQSSVSELTSDKEEIVLFFIPGVFFCTLAIRWSVILLCKWSLEAKTSALELTGLPPPPSNTQTSSVLPYLGNLPWEGLVKIFLVIVAVGVSVTQTQLSPSIIIILSMYVMFLISGIMDIFLFFCGYSVLPEGIQSFILAVCFSVEAICFHGISTASTQHFMFLLIILIICCSFSSILEIIFDNRLVKFCRTFFSFLQSSWLMHLSILLAQDSLLSPVWTSILFIWHLSATFLLSMFLLLITHYCSRPILPPLPPPPLSGSSSQLVPCKFIKLPTGDLSNEGIKSQPYIFHTMNKGGKENQGKSPSVVDVEPWDRIQRMQYTSFQNSGQ